MDHPWLYDTNMSRAITLPSPMAGFHCVNTVQSCSLDGHKLFQLATRAQGY